MTASERERSILEREPQVIGLSCLLFRQFPRAAEFRNDVIQSAWVGAIEAVDRYDPTCETSLESFAHFRINGAIWDYWRYINRRDRSAAQDGRPVFKYYDHSEVLRRRLGDAHALDHIHWTDANLSLEALYRRTKMLTGMEIFVLKALYWDGWKQKAIGQYFGLTTDRGCTRISQIKNEGIRKLRAVAQV